MNVSFANLVCLASTIKASSSQTLTTTATTTTTVQLSLLYGNRKKIAKDQRPYLRQTLKDGEKKVEKEILAWMSKAERNGEKINEQQPDVCLCV